MLCQFVDPLCGFTHFAFGKLKDDPKYKPEDNICDRLYGRTDSCKQRGQVVLNIARSSLLGGVNAMHV